jgi:cold shock CspA family protein
MQDRLVGTVVWYDPERAYGFIAAEGRDIFVHRTALTAGRAWLVEGQQVTFSLRLGGRGPEASAVEVLVDTAIPSQRARAYRAEARRIDWATRHGYTAREAAPRRNRGHTATQSTLVNATVIDCFVRRGTVLIRIDETGIELYVPPLLLANWSTLPVVGSKIGVTLAHCGQRLRVRSIEQR